MPARLISSESLNRDKEVAVINQLELEQNASVLAECIEKEKALQGFEGAQITTLNAEIVARTKERDAIQDAYLNYDKTANSLAARFHQELDRKQTEIQELQTQVRGFDQVSRERDRRISELSRVSDEIRAR